MLQVNYSYDALSYSEDITELDETAIIKARKVVIDYINKGILINKSFDEDIWILDDQNQTRTLSFAKETPSFDNYCKRLFKFSARFFITLQKTYITLNFGAAASSLQSATSEITAFARYLTGNLSIDDLKTTGANKLVDFISLLPENQDAEDVREELELYIQESYSSLFGEQRVLAQFRSYLRFEDLLNDFWEEASEPEKIQYFPIWFWWKVSTLIPLRPTEVTLTPRKCITKDDKLTVRRTLQKKKNFSSEYRLELDYAKYFYRVPIDIMDTIKWYLAATADSYVSNEDILFSLNTSHAFAPARLNAHYTYNDMNTLLKQYYQKIIADKYGYEIVDFSDGNVSELLNNEIEFIKLGDTRHLAMVSIFITTKNPEMCRELAGHSDINISSHYYTNMQNFIKAVSFDRVKKQNTITVPQPQNQSKALSVTQKTKLKDGGFCLSENIAKGNFEDCKYAVDADGHLFACSACQYYISANFKTIFNAKDLSQCIVTDTEFKESFSFLIEAINRARTGLGLEEDIQSAFLQMQAAAKQYENKLVKQYAMEEYYGTTIQN